MKRAAQLTERRVDLRPFITEQKQGVVKDIF